MDDVWLYLLLHNATKQYKTWKKDDGTCYFTLMAFSIFVVFGRIH